MLNEWRVSLQDALVLDKRRMSVRGGLINLREIESLIQLLDERRVS